jgi:hypothetical protein
MRRSRLIAACQAAVVMGGALMLQGCVAGAVVGGTAAVVGGAAKAGGAVVGAGFDAVTTSDEETRAAANANSANTNASNAAANSARGRAKAAEVSTGFGDPATTTVAYSDSRAVPHPSIY